VSVGELGKAVLGQLIEGAVRTLTGDKPIGTAVRDAITEAADDTAKMIHAKAQELVDRFGLVLAIRDYADDIAKLPSAFEPDGTVPDLGLDLTVVGPDEKLEETVVQPVDEKFDDGDR
jgi:hypothetical protein